MSHQPITQSYRRMVGWVVSICEYAFVASLFVAAFGKHFELVEESRLMIVAMGGPFLVIANQGVRTLLADTENRVVQIEQAFCEYEEACAKDDETEANSHKPT